MKIEHVAWNVPDSRAMADWYTEHLGMIVRRRGTEPPYAQFLTDDSGTVMIELYANEDAPSLPFPDTDPAAVHLAFVSEDVEAECSRLQRAGASVVRGPHYLGADHFAMLRDPWGIPLQLVRRGSPMI